MRAFVTGGTGFLGRRLVRRLMERGDEVRMLVRPSSNAQKLSFLGVDRVVGDLADVTGFAQALNGCDVVYHLGARVETGGDWRSFVEPNVQGTHALIEAAAAASVGRFVHVSSLGIFDIPSDGTTIGEGSPYDGCPALRGHYTRSKIHADRIACAAVRAGRAVVVVRPGVLYGADRDRVKLYLGRVSKRFSDRVLIVLGKPSYPIPLCYVENAAEAVLRAGTVDDLRCGIFNIVDDPDLTHEKYFRVLGEVGGCPRHVVFIPVASVAPGVVALDRAYRVLKRRTWPAAYQLLRSGRSAKYTVDAAHSCLGWKPPVELRAALDRTVHGSA